MLYLNESFVWSVTSRPLADNSVSRSGRSHNDLEVCRSHETGEQVFIPGSSFDQILNVQGVELSRWSRWKLLKNISLSNRATKCGSNESNINRRFVRTPFSYCSSSVSILSSYACTSSLRFYCLSGFFILEIVSNVRIAMQKYIAASVN